MLLKLCLLFGNMGYSFKGLKGLRLCDLKVEVEEDLILRRAREKISAAWQEPQDQWTLVWYGALPELRYSHRRAAL